MKVLWFEMKVPGRYQKGHPIGGWQDALENIICKYSLKSVKMVLKFLISDEDKVIEVKESDNKNIIIISIVSVLAIVVLVLLRKKLKK